MSLFSGKKKDAEEDVGLPLPELEEALDDDIEVEVIREVEEPPKIVKLNARPDETPFELPLDEDPLEEPELTPVTLVEAEAAEAAILKPAGKDDILSAFENVNASDPKLEALLEKVSDVSASDLVAELRDVCERLMGAAPAASHE